MATTKKTSSSTASRKAAPAAKAAAAAPAAPAADPAPAPVAKVKAPALKIKDLVTRVAEATGGKRKGVKEMVEATLAALGDALSKGEDLNLPGLGRTRIARMAEKDGGSLMTLKVRRGVHKKKEAKEPLAEDEDDG